MFFVSFHHPLPIITIADEVSNVNQISLDIDPAPLPHVRGILAISIRVSGKPHNKAIYLQQAKKVLSNFQSSNSNYPIRLDVAFISTETRTLDSFASAKHKYFWSQLETARFSGEQVTLVVAGNDSLCGNIQSMHDFFLPKRLINIAMSTPRSAWELASLASVLRLWDQIKENKDPTHDSTELHILGHISRAARFKAESSLCVGQKAGYESRNRNHFSLPGQPANSKLSRGGFVKLHPDRDGKFACPSGCVEIRFTDQKELSSHVMDHRTDPSSSDWTCPILVCSKTFENREKRVLREHLETHYNPDQVQCHICQASFYVKPRRTISDGLREHLEKHKLRDTVVKMDHKIQALCTHSSVSTQWYGLPFTDTARCSA